MIVVYVRMKGYRYVKETLLINKDIFIPGRKNGSNGKKSLLKNFCVRTKRSTSDTKTEEGPDELSISSSGCGSSPERSRLLRLEPRTLTKQISLADKIGMGGYGCVYRGKWHGDTIAVKIFLSSEEASWSREVEIYKTPGLNHDNILRYIAADNIVSIYQICSLVTIRGSFSRRIFPIELNCGLPRNIMKMVRCMIIFKIIRLLHEL